LPVLMRDVPLFARRARYIRVYPPRRRPPDASSSALTSTMDKPDKTPTHARATVSATPPLQTQARGPADGDAFERADAHAFDMAAKKVALRAFVLASYQEAYKERTDNWKSLETKAQGSITIAGIFIAGAFAYIDKGAATMTAHQQFLAIIAVASLVASVLLAVYALKIQEVLPPPYGNFVKANVERFLEVDDEAELKVRVEYFDYDMISQWERVLNVIDEQLGKKVDCLFNAQASLVFAVVVVAILAVSRVVVR
jgi:hypothetical protein